MELTEFMKVVAEKMQEAQNKGDKEEFKRLGLLATETIGETLRKINA